MANYNYTDLLARVTAVVYSNESQEIKAQKLQELLGDIIDSSVNLTYDPARTYYPGAAAIFNPGGGPLLYQCTIITTGVFAPASWLQVGI
jgi:hypothetical protein